MRNCSSARGRVIDDRPRGPRGRGHACTSEPSIPIGHPRRGARADQKLSAAPGSIAVAGAMAARQTLLALLFVAAAGAGGHAAAAVAGKVPTGSTLCCTNTTGYHECVEACFHYYPREQAEKFCDPGCQEAYQCHAVPGEKCPSSSLHHSSDLLTNSVVGEVVQPVTTTLCCSNMTGFHECVEDCFAYFPREQADKICDPGCKEAYQCRTVSGDKCPSEHPSSGSVVGEVVQAATKTLCCSNMTGFHECVEDCFGYFPREQAEKICDPGCQEAYQCRTVSGDKCPTNSAKGAAVEKCVSGCKSSVCSKMVTGVGSKLFAVKHALDRCNNACYKFCTKGLRAGTATA
uniref:Uncharacterized protein n=2 Tax=Setaria italica TaxID=4555 RepID=K3XXZ9_SETIT